MRIGRLPATRLGAHIAFDKEGAMNKDSIFIGGLLAFQLLLLPQLLMI